MAKLAYLTPDSSAFSSATVGRSLCIPFELLYLIDGAVQELTKAENFEQFGTATPEECAEYFTELLDTWEPCP